MTRHCCSNEMQNNKLMLELTYLLKYGNDLGIESG
uniref:Uncharacterized protein n=1 Tax=Arundo donax TaxID=35708 RepID=A0A0A9FKS2_ARUDO